ncbi:MAG: HDOD domain-containing protein [Oscillospiraceae bacterium]|jgi:EAL and modified HD-GYP domain-containing signal transduction protein|nr:HDOD domain-containing protein [Oscillospiraceae bacterium]
MKTFIVAIPFFSSDMSVVAYRLNSRSGQNLLGMMVEEMSMSDAVLTPGLDLVKTIGVEPLTGGCPLFIDINEYHLLMRMPIVLDILPEQLVCVLTNRINPDDVVIEKCKELKELGFKIAIDGLLSGHTKNPLFEFIDYIIIDVSDFTLDEKFIETIKAFSQLKQIVLSNIPTMDSFNTLAGIPDALYCGGFFSQPITKGIGKISPIKINALTLLKRLSEDDFDLGDIADTIGHDPSLSISLLRFINTVMPREIVSIRNAVAILGQKEVKRWATAAISIQLAEDRPSEITKLSLVRARFAENLAKAFNMGVFAPSLFMLGLFSLLDVIMEMPIENAVKEVALDEAVRTALVDKTGDFYKVLDFIYSYEHANWDDIAIKMVKYNLELEEVTTAFVDALVWYKTLLDSISADEEQSK